MTTVVPVLDDIRRHFKEKGVIKVLGRDEKIEFPCYDEDFKNEIQGPTAVLLFGKQGGDIKGSINFFKIDLNGPYLTGFNIDDNPATVREIVSQRIVKYCEHHGPLEYRSFRWDKNEITELTWPCKH